MSKIKIKNFGPIKEGYQENDGWMDIKKVTVFIGNQGSGKSTVAKLISTLSWLEKAINKGDIKKEKISFNSIKELLKYHKINNYFSSNTLFHYKGLKYEILYDSNRESPIIDEINDVNYTVPKILYVPADRNFLTSIYDSFTHKDLPGNIFRFGVELKKAQKDLKDKIKLPIGYTYEYDEDEDTSFVVGENYRINLTEASSGLQSYIPLYIVSHYLSSKFLENRANNNKEFTVNQAVRLSNEIKSIMNDSSLSEDEKNKSVKMVNSKYINKCFFNIVEEPEQNLFPTTQWELLKSLLEFNNLNKNNKLLMTTHSPYFINYLTLAVKAHSLYKKINTAKQRKKIEKIVTFSSIVDPDDLVIYELTDKGNISKLGDYKGLPSDENQLNERLGETNELFGQLLEIQQSYEH